MSSSTSRSSAVEKLSGRTEEPVCLAGFDGFVDQILHLVGERTDVDQFQRLEQMSAFGELILEASGKSANVELVPQQTKLGGNGPIMAQALLSLGNAVSYAGALGTPEIHPVFRSFAEDCDRVLSIADPGRTDALEFHDGKLMLGKMQSLKNVTWDRLLEHISRENLLELLRETDLVACLNWTMVPYMNGILEGVAELLPELESRVQLFMDLADPRKRTARHKRAVMERLRDLQEQADVMLGLNEEESEQIAEVLDLSSTPDHTKRAERIRRDLGLSRVVVHPVKTAHVATPDHTASVEGPYTASPEISTGAGDHFNAGYVFGELLGLTPGEALQAGVHCSGYYVRNAAPPSRTELVEFMVERM